MNPIGFLLCLVFFAVVIGQAFWSYKLRHFYRIFSGFLAGVLISFTTGYLMFMDSITGKVTDFVISHGGDKLLADMVSDSDILGLLQLLVKNKDVRDILMKILPDSAKVFMIFAVLLCIACTIVCAVLDKPGAALELFAYGYTLVALMFAANGSVLLGGILGIMIGVLLGILGYRFSRVWIIVAPNIFNFLVAYSFFISAALVPAVVAILGVRKQLKAIAVPKDGAAQPAAASAGPMDKWTEKCRALAGSVSAKLSAHPKSNPTQGSAPLTGGQKFCGKCGNSLASDAKFCAKCGTPTRSVEDSAKPM